MDSSYIPTVLKIKNFCEYDRDVWERAEKEIETGGKVSAQIINTTPALEKWIVDKKKNLSEIFIRERNNKNFHLQIGSKYHSFDYIPQNVIYYGHSFEGKIKVKQLLKMFNVINPEDRKVFFSIKSYKDHIRSIQLAQHEHKYNLFSYQPEEYDTKFHRAFPTILLSDEENKKYPFPERNPAKLSQLLDPRTKFYDRNPPMLISSFNELPDYKKRKLISTLKESPHILNPIYITVEYSPYQNDMITYIRELKKIWDDFNKYEELTGSFRNISSHIDYLLMASDTKDPPYSKLDLIIHYIKTQHYQLYCDEIQNFMYDISLIDNEAYTEEGMYVIRRNGILNHIIYVVKFPIIEHWKVTTTQYGYLDLKLILSGGIGGYMLMLPSNLFYYTSKDPKKMIKVEKRYLDWEGNQTDTTPTSPLDIAQKVNVEHIYKDYDQMERKYTLYLLHRSLYFYNEIPLNSNDTLGETFQGTVRGRGIKIVHFHLKKDVS